MRFFKSVLIAVALIMAPAASFAKDGKLTQSEILQRADITVGLNGLVCDFCTLALNKTFNKHAAVSDILVDLDAKSMTLALTQGQSLSNEQITEMVKDAGYNVTKIARKDGTIFTPPAKS